MLFRCKCLMMEAAKKKILKKRHTHWLLLSFFIPALLLGIGFVLQNVYPFGDRQILVVDFWHQYYPFIRLLHEKLQNGESLLFTWQSGMGTNFLPILAYYAASPLNFLTIIVPEVILREAVTVILLMKVGFAGLFFALFLRGMFHRNDASLLLFSSMYALCSYILGYYWNIIWLDTVALLPLVALGLVYLVRDGKYRTYIIALGLSLFCNFYIGIFTCIFAVVWFLCLCVFYLRPKLLPGRVVLMLISSLLGGALAAVLLIPTYQALQLTYSVQNTFPSTWEFYTSFREVLANVISFHAPTSKDGLPNLASGILCLILLGPFLRSALVRIREKVAAVFFLSFLIISCNCNVLNYIWHGCHFPNLLPYRFSFLFSFVLITVAYRAFTLMLEQKWKIYDVLAMLFVLLGVFLLSYGIQEDKAVFYSFVIGLLYVVILIFYYRNLLSRKMMYVSMSLVLCVELFQNVRLGTEQVSTSDRDSYPYLSASVEPLLDKVEHLESMPGNTRLNRTELSSWYTLNAPALYGYHGFSLFSSTANASVSRWMDGMGFPASEAGNRYYYAGGTPLSNLFSNIMYLVGAGTSVMDTENWEQIAIESNCYLYQNRYPGAIGFCVKSDLQKYELYADTDPFVNQNELFRLATGIEEELFTKVEIQSTSCEGMTLTPIGGDNYSYQLEQGANQRKMEYSFSTSDKTNLYGYFYAEHGGSISVLKNGSYYNRYAYSAYPYIFSMGTCQSGDTLSLSTTFAEDASSGWATVYAYRMNQEVWEKGYKKLISDAFTVEMESDTEIVGNVTATEDGLCYFSIPYDRGWHVEVDGEPAEVVLIGDAMISVPVSAGTHTIRLSYCPPGFVVGSCMTGGAVLILVAAFVVERKRNRTWLTPVKIGTA